MSARRDLVDRVSAAAVLALGVGLVAWAVRLVWFPEPSRLDVFGVWAEDGWSRNATAALALATGLASLGLARVRGLRRLVAVGLLALSALGLAIAARALDVLALWSGVALAVVLAPLALAVADERERAAAHALNALLLGSLAAGVLGLGLAALSALAGTTHLLEIGIFVERFEDAGPFALTALRAAAVAVALLAAWAPFHLGLPELWGEGSAPLAAWLAAVWPWAGWTVLVRLAGGLAPALAEWSMNGAAAVSLFLVLGAFVPGLAAVAEMRVGRLLALLAIGNLSELLLAVRAEGVAVPLVASGLWGVFLAQVVTAAALGGVRARLGGDGLETLRGLGVRHPARALALAIAAVLWIGLPGTFSLAVRWQLWQDRGASPLAVGVVVVGAFVRLLAAARLVRVLYLLPAPRSEEAVPPAIPRALEIRWAAAFVLACLVELALGLGPASWAARLGAGAQAILGG